MKKMRAVLPLLLSMSLLSCPALAEDALSSAGQAPSSVAEAPLSTEQAPSSAEQTLSSAEQTPSSAGQALPSAEQASSSAGQALSSVAEVPSSAGQALPSAEQTSLSAAEAPPSVEETMICNFSEIAPLKKVLLQRPGDEFLNLTPNTLEELLFDDIPYLKTAQEEHDTLAEVLRAEGVEVVYLTDLFAETLDAGGAGLRKQFLEQFIAEAGVTSPSTAKMCYEFLDGFEDNRDMIAKCIAGTDITEIKDLDSQTGFYSAHGSTKMLLPPIPNIYFQRDPMSTVGNGVTIHRMWSGTRNRESIFADYIFRYHPDYKDTKRYYDRTEAYPIEGGDIQVLSDEVVAVGISQRTTPDAIAMFATRLFADGDAPFKVVLAIEIPKERSFMHLDTVMTRADVDVFAVQEAVMDISTIYEITGGSDGGLLITELHDPLAEVLARYLHLDHVDLVKCGNGNRIDAEREQWSDGVNLLCIRPGVVVAYDRNFVTNEALREHGITVIEIPSAELSRGRGGSHCMTMALCREGNS